VSVFARISNVIKTLRARNSLFLAAQAMHESASIRIVVVTAVRKLQGIPGLQLKEGLMFFCLLFLHLL
jgi:hypothetical protein